MKKLSYWAKTHPIQARCLIVGAHSLLFLLAFTSGLLLWMDDFEHNALINDAFTTLFILGVIGYPIKGVKNVLWRHSYLRQKGFDFLVVFSGFLALSSFCGMKMDQTPAYTSKGIVLKTAYHLQEGTITRVEKSNAKISWRNLIIKFRKLKNEWKQVKKMAQEKGDNVGLKVLYTFLIVLLALGLSILIILLACNLSCAGEEGAAVLVGLGGGALIITLTVMAIKAAWGKKKKKIESTPNSDIKPQTT